MKLTSLENCEPPRRSHFDSSCLLCLLCPQPRGFHSAPNPICFDSYIAHSASGSNCNNNNCNYCNHNNGNHLQVSQTTTQQSKLAHHINFINLQINQKSIHSLKVVHSLSYIHSLIDCLIQSIIHSSDQLQVSSTTCISICSNQSANPDASVNPIKMRSQTNSSTSTKPSTSSFTNTTSRSNRNNTLLILTTIMALLVSLLLFSRAADAAAAGPHNGPPPNSSGAPKGIFKRSFAGLGCLGVYDKAKFARLDRVCEECYQLYREPDIHMSCRQDCFRNNVFTRCVDALLLSHEQKKFDEMVDELYGK